MKPFRIPLIVLLTAAAVAVGWKLASSVAPTLSSQTMEVSPPSRSLAPSPAPAAPPPSQQAGASTAVAPAAPSKPKSPVDLLAEFDLTGDRTLLVQAQKWFPHDQRVLMATCLTATDPKSTWLAELEKVQSDNLLPNLVRAALLAKKGDLKGFAEELRKASSKTKLDTQLRDRQAEQLDRILVGKGFVPRSLHGTMDNTFFNNLELIFKTCTNNPRLLGDDVSSASTAVALATTFRNSTGLDVSYTHYGNYLELGMLQKLSGDIEYGDSGVTVAQRTQELKKMVTESGNTLARYHQLVTDPSADPVLKLQFYARMRSDGEQAAIEWLFSRPAKR